MNLSALNFSDIPWCVLRDFSSILHSSDKSGGRAFNTNLSVQGFHDFVKSYDLMDLGFFGPKYT